MRLGPLPSVPKAPTPGMIPTHVLGISAFYHDSAACLLRDGAIVAAAQEERFTRKKGDASFPAHAVRYCLQSAGISAADLAYVGFYDKPLLKFERILETYLGVAPRGFRSFLLSAPVWLKDKLYWASTGRSSTPSITSPMPRAPSFRRRSKQRPCSRWMG